MTTDDNQDNADDDDLTVINGIGTARQTWFQETFGVRRFADLAALSVDRVEAALKEGKRTPVTRSDIEGWLAQAGELAAERSKEAPKSAAPSDTEPDWTPFASFVVEYRCRDAADPAERHQTHIHHVEGDVSETWQGLQGESLGPWMLDHAQKLAEPEPEAAAGEGDSEPETADMTLPVDADVRVEVTEVRIRKPNDAAPSSPSEAGPPTLGPIRDMDPFALDADFELTGSGAADLTERVIPFMCQFYARDLATGASLHLGDAIPGNLTAGQVVYQATLHFARLQAGAYRLHVLVIIQTSPPLPGHLDLSVLQVL